jgi:hypothetical protein
MSNTENWALRELRYNTVPELKRNIRNLEEDARAMRDHITTLEKRVHQLEEVEP